MNRRLALIAVIFLSLFLANLVRAEGPVMIVDDPALLAALDTKGFGFAGIFGVDGGGDLKALYDKAPAYHRIVETVAGDVAALRAEMKAGGRPLYEVTDGNVGRIMDMRWLKTDAARFRLVGVVNRLDRRDFADIRATGAAARCVSSIALPTASRKMARFWPRACRSTSMLSTAPRRTPTAAASALPGAGRRSSTRPSIPAGSSAGRWRRPG
ncbi:hypothetical protein BQ8482_60222 [Mesorhizobium delmotii]|uniref:Uncharacterized protein n=1 Tax=Mesorhizobium delmotii TaxID=1631247 RepID=A0A2P9AVN1_9HYPH|nr:hypothetical protein BQ8482_60222 [Mesorhizobium delmotii]